MSLLNTLSEKIAESGLANNVGLSRFTSTTFAQAGTSLSRIAKDAVQKANSSLVSSGAGEQTLHSPITAMKDYAASADPINAASYEQSASLAQSVTADSFSTLTPGSNNSIVDIQNSVKNSMAYGVNNFGQSIANINPAISTLATSIGTDTLGSISSTIDNSCTAAYGSVKSFLNDTVSGTNEAIAAKAAADALKEAPIVNPLPTELGVTADSAKELQGATTAGVSEEDPPNQLDNSTDIIYQDIKLYIEGIQVPFESASVSQAIGQLPTASFQIPPSSALMDIARYYQPKVHIFYTDTIQGGDRLLFWGHIVACNYTKSATSGSNIIFECIHKNALLQQITFEWSGNGISTIAGGGNLSDSVSTGAGQSGYFSSEQSLITSLKGLTGMQTELKDLMSPENPQVGSADVTKLDHRFVDFEKRLIGMPAATMNMWNQQKAATYANEKYSAIFSKMYIPLLEEGVRFFDRLTGHYFLENQIQNSRVKHCNDKGRPELGKVDTLLPPAFRMDIQSAVQSRMAIASLKNSLQFSGELMSFYDLMTNFYYGIEYELLTLASPGEVPVDPTIVADPDDIKQWSKLNKMATEVVIKPQLPFYYAPICNVLLPNMYFNLNISQNEYEIPSRVTGVSTASSQANDNPMQLAQNYRAPQSIREALAIGQYYLNNKGAKPQPGVLSLKGTTGYSWNIPGKYELGRGIKHKKILMPDWLSNFSKEQNEGRGSKDEQVPFQDTLEYKQMQNLHLAWIEKYGYSASFNENDEFTGIKRDTTLDTLDPYSKDADIQAYERLLFSAADYEFTREVVKSKQGNAECIFNPYIIPGYPMDIIAESSNDPSFHATCSSISHSISPRGVTTSVGFLAATTYTELSIYYMQPVHPWLRSALSMVNIKRKAIANEQTLQDNAKTATDISVSISSNATKDSTAADVKKIDDVKNLSIGDALANADKAEKGLHEMSTKFGLPADDAYDMNTGDVEEIQEGIINNPRAKAVADQFYRSVLGIGAADPTMMFDFNKGGPMPLKRINGNWQAGTSASVPIANGGEGNDNLTGIGNLRLISRPIEGKRSIQAKFDIKFIDLLPENYTNSSIVYDPSLEVEIDGYLEPGASMFLDYPEVSTTILDTINTKQAKTGAK